MRHCAQCCGKGGQWGTNVIESGVTRVYLERMESVTDSKPQKAFKVLRQKSGKSWLGMDGERSHGPNQLARTERRGEIKDLKGFFMFRGRD